MNALKKYKIGFFLIVLGGLFVSCKKEVKEEIQILNVPYITATTQDVPLYRDFAAQTYGDLDIDLKARVDGILKGVHFKEGQRVSKGQLLYTIEPLEYDTKVEQVRGQVSMNQSNLVNAESDLKRIRTLAEINAVSKRELDAAVARAQAARAVYNSSNAALKNQQLERSYCNITSPITGVIGISTVGLGDYVSKLGTASILNTVSVLDKVRVRFTVSESDYLKYKKDRIVGDNLNTLELLLSDGTIHPHKGTFNFSNASIDPNTGTTTIESTFSNPEFNLRAGQFAKVRVNIKTEKDVIVIPQKAVTEMQGVFQVMTINPDNTIKMNIVEVGAKVGNNWIVLKGLNPNDKIAISGNSAVQVGTKVNPIPFVEEATTPTSKN